MRSCLFHIYYTIIVIVIGHIQFPCITSTSLILFKTTCNNIIIIINIILIIIIIIITSNNIIKFIVAGDIFEIIIIIIITCHIITVTYNNIEVTAANIICITTLIARTTFSTSTCV